MQKPKRASVRIATKGITKTLPSKRIRKRVEGILKKRGNVWAAVRNLYNIKQGNVSSRDVVSPYFHPVYRKYNPTQNKFLKDRNAIKAIKRSIYKKNIANMLVPLHGVKRGGVHPGYVVHALENANTKYAIVNEKGNLRSFSLVKNYPNSRYINVIAAIPSYGHPMMNKILNNAKRDGKEKVNLKAVTDTKNNQKANNDALVRWYKTKGFERSGSLNSNSLLPMSVKLQI